MEGGGDGGVGEAGGDFGGRWPAFDGNRGFPAGCALAGAFAAATFRGGAAVLLAFARFAAVAGFRGAAFLAAAFRGEAAFAAAFFGC